MPIPSVARRAAHGMVTLQLLALTLAAPPALGTEPTPGEVTPKAPEFDWYPRRPADTSSPRDAPRSFNDSMNEAYEGIQKGRSWESIKRAADRALETFDFSQLPDRRGRANEVLLGVKSDLTPIG